MFSQGLSSGHLLALAAMVLMLGLAGIIVRWGRGDRFRSGSRVSAFLSDLAPILACSALVVIFLALVLAAFAERAGEASPLDRSLLPGFAASLLEDVVFFIAVGVVIFIVQRREFERGRPAADRIDTLFNAKRLTPGELRDLEIRIRESSCDFQRCEAHIDVRDWNDDTEGLACVRLDVHRKWHVTSYLSDGDASYAWRLNIKPDDIPKVTPLLQVYPSTTRTYRLGRSGTPTRYSAARLLNALTVQDTPEPYLYPEPRPGHKPVLETIPAGEVRMFAARYLVWQRLADAHGSPDPWTFSMNHHWDEFVLQISNSLPRSINVIIKGEVDEEYPLQAGESTELLRYRDVSRDAKFLIEFAVA